MTDREDLIPRDSARAMPEADPVPLAEVVLGGRYVIGQELGRGGMGRVLQARDLKLGRTVAVKVLNAGAHQPRQRERFEQEARAAGALNHANIVAVHDVGEHGGEPYIISELLEGDTLRARLRGGPLTTDEALDIGTQLASGIAAAHRRGIVHRDLKPENLFVTREGQLKILDFGIAKLMPGTQGTGRARTDSDSVIGTPEYMSPEQLKRGSADARSDVFACGAVLHEMLTGKPPFDRGGSVETAYAVLHDPPAPLPDSGLSPIIARCLQKAPAARYANGAELLDDLKRLARGVPISAPRARRRSPMLAVAIAVSLAAGAVLLVRNARHATARTRIAVADVVNDTGEQDLDSLSGMLITSLEQSRHLSVLTRSRMFEMLHRLGKPEFERIGETPGRDIAREAGAKALVLAHVRRFGDLYAIDLKLLDPERNEYLFAAKEQGLGKESIPGLIDRLSEQVRSGLDEKAADIRSARVPVALSTTSSLEAYRHFFAGEQLYIRRMDDHGAADEFREALKLDPEFALAHLRLAQVSEGSAGAHLERAMHLAGRLSERELCSAHALRSMLSGRDAEALASVKVCADRYPDDEWTVLRAGDWSFHQGDLDAAARYLGKVLARNSLNAEAYHHLISIWHLRGNVDRIVAAAAGQVREHHELDPYDHLVWAQWIAGDGDAAEKTLGEMERLFPGAWTPFRIRMVRDLFAGEPEKAEALLGRPELADAGVWERGYSNFIIQWTRGRFRKALAIVDEMSAAHPEESPLLTLWKAWALAARGDTASASRWAAEVLRAEANQVKSNPAYRRHFFPKRLFALHCQLGEPDAASAMLESQEVMPLELSGLGIRLEAARARRQGRLDEEISAYERLASGDPIWRPATLLRLGALHFEANQPRKAIDALRTGLNGLSVVRQRMAPQPGPGDQDFVFNWYRLAKAYESAGEPAAALETYHRVLRMWSDADPDTPELIDARARAGALE